MLAQHSDLGCRHAKSQKAQVLGQAIGLPLCMAAFTFTGLAVTSATQAIFGRIISDPVELLSQLSSPLAVSLGLLGVPWMALCDTHQHVLCALLSSLHTS